MFTTATLHSRSLLASPTSSYNVRSENPMANSRRQFLDATSLSLAGIAAAISASAQDSTTPGAPPAFGTAPPVGPEVSFSTFAEAEKLVQVQLTASERIQAAGNWSKMM